MLLPLTAEAVMDLNRWWELFNPALSEERFRAALATAQGDEARAADYAARLARARGKA